MLGGDCQRGAYRHFPPPLLNRFEKRFLDAHDCDRQEKLEALREFAGQRMKEGGPLPVQQRATAQSSPQFQSENAVVLYCFVFGFPPGLIFRVFLCHVDQLCTESAA